MNSFLFDAVIYLVAAILCVPITKKFGLSSVLGYLFAGILIGPYVLGMIGHEGEDVMHFAEFGVVMMLFVIGLELEPKKFWRMRNYVLGMGTFQLVGSVLLIFIATWLLLGWEWNTAMAVALSLGVSSTAIVLQTLEEKDLSKTFAGRSSFAVLLYQDIAVIPILSLLPLMATVDTITTQHKNLVDGLPSWLHAVVVLGTIATVAFVGRLVVIPLLRIVAKTNLQELFVASALLVVFGVSYVMQLVGLSPALGAFMAGVVLANSEFRYELEGNIAPFKGLLLGLFFIGVGASINFPLILNKPLFVLFSVVLMMGIKFGVLYLLGLLYKKRLDQNMLFSFLLSQAGEFGFVIISFAAAIGLVNKELSGLVMAVIAISMVCTPFLLLINEKWIAPNFGVKEEEEPKNYDEIEEGSEVIIAGFGHFGSTVGRMLKANGIKATVLDHNSERVSLLREMGFKVYYGDATRRDLLEAAGIEKAKIFIIAIDNIAVSIELAEKIKERYPKVKVFVRAKTRNEAYQLIEHGVKYIYRQYLYAAIKVSEDVLSELGFRRYTAARQGIRFIRHDEKMTRALAKKHHDWTAYLEKRKEEVELQEEVLKGDLYSSLGAIDHSWDSEELKNE